MKIGDTVKQSQSYLSTMPPVVQAHLREIRWEVLEVAGVLIKVKQIGGYHRVSWVRMDEFEVVATEPKQAALA